jgi:hypothetical protein
LVFQKRYDDICVEWLGGLTVLAHKSKIVGEQLGRHLDQLVQARFLASYQVKQVRTRGKDGFTITFQPGPLFYDDYDRFYRRRQVRTGSNFAPDREDIGEPLKVAYLFAEKRSGHSPGSIAFVPTKDVETAKQLLTVLRADEVPAFIDFALAEARKTDFNVQTLCGIKQYLATYLASRKTRAAEKVREAARRQHEQAEAEQQAYDNFRRAQASEIFCGLPDMERHAIELEAHAHAAKFSGSLRDAMVRFGTIRFTMERHHDKLRTFEQWKADRRTS